MERFVNVPASSYRSARRDGGPLTQGPRAGSTGKPLKPSIALSGEGDRDDVVARNDHVAAPVLGHRFRKVGTEPTLEFGKASFVETIAPGTVTGRSGTTVIQNEVYDPSRDIPL